MTPDAAQSWFERNQRYLSLGLARLRHLLEQHPAGADLAQEFPRQAELQSLRAAMQVPPALETLRAVFGLSPFEADVLLLCASIELDSGFAGSIAARRGDPKATMPTFSLALTVLPEAHWSALTPNAPLRFWRLIELGSGSVVTQLPLRIDERILHYLAGITHLDERLTGYLTPLRAPNHGLVPSQEAIVDEIASAWGRGSWRDRPPLIQLVGSDPTAHQAITAAVSSRLDLVPYVLRSTSLPASPVEIESLQRLWEREALLTGGLLLVDGYQSGEGELAQEALLNNWIESLRTPLILSSRARRHARRPLMAFEVSKPTRLEQHDLWDQALGPLAASLDGRMEAIVSHFDLDADTIRQISLDAVEQEAASPEELARRLWKACNAHSRPILSDLAQYIRPLATWEDLVLPEAQLQTLREVSVHVRHRLVVYESWGFATRSARGLGISALFSGVSGTGKTMAAEVLANELGLDLFRIDLSQVVSKFIGETEKNLRRVFDAAEEGGAILLFDEADALFGKRSEVKDSHDRYANVEVSYLLQRMEAYRGLAILTTNLREAIDTAFLRRIRFVVQFPFPDLAQRVEIWRRIFPAETPTDGLDVDRLGRLSVTGGNIHNIALYAAFLAAEAGQPVCMRHLLRAARVEYDKLERPLSEAEIGGWG
ncbi:MAG: ATP-binding protein [Anaerolineales bacterium]|nr:ATP-binding protein [Anaerolineales bacterium]